MEQNPHFTELLQRLSVHSVEFLIVGGYAVVKYSEPRFTKDLDIWIRNAPENAKRVWAALTEWGAPLQTDNVTAEDFSSDDMTYQIGRPPLRVDILPRIDGVVFQDAWARRTPRAMAGTVVNFISLEDQIRNKASGRASDVEQLRQLLKRKPK